MGKVRKTSAKVETSDPNKVRQNLKKSSNKITTKDGKVKKKIPKQFTLYKCNVCNKKFTDKYNLQSHLKIHSTDVFSCPICPYKGKTKKYLARHQKKVHSAPTEHKCNVCGKMFHYECKLREHVMVHTGEKPHKCDICGKGFRVTFSLNAHMLIHKNEKPYKCSFCDYACRDNSTLRKHENRHMGVVKMFACKICPKKFPDKAKLKYHISEVHLNYLELDLRKHFCEICKKTFKCKFNLNKHVQAVHEKSLGGKCPVCGLYLTNMNNLPAHLRTHFDERPYACKHPKCAKRFKDKNTLKKHTVIHSPHLHHSCRVCGGKFARAHRLALHMRVHQPRDKWAECHYCGAAFYSKNYLIKHITRKHVANKEKFICEHCGLVTYNKPSIVMHLKYGHLHDEDLYCKLCKTKYKRHIYLKAHYLKTHNIRYKSKKRRIREEKKPSVEVKVEPIDAEPGEEIHLMDVSKEEVLDEDDPNPENDLMAYSKHVLSEELAECLLSEERGIPEDKFDVFLFQHVFHKQIKQEELGSQDEVNEDQRTFVSEKIKEIIEKSRKTETAELLERRKKNDARKLEKKLRREAKMMRRKGRQEIYELERVRQMYNERMKAAADKTKKEPVKKIKYFQKKTNNETDASKQTDKNNGSHSKEHSEHSNDETLSKNDDSYNINDSTNDDTRDKDADSRENVSNCANNIDVLLNDANNDRSNDSNDQMIGSNTDKNTESDVTTIKHPGIDKTNDVNDNIDIINDKPKDDDAKDDAINEDDLNDASKDNKDATNDEDDSSNDEKSDNGSNYDPNSEDCSEDETTGNKKMTFKTHQCYICFKLYPTKDDLIAHCQCHFDICNTTTLAKCPVCAHVANRNIAKHMLKAHDIQVKLPYTRITDRKNNTAGSRYCYKMDNNSEVMEIIPSVKILNYNAAIQIDKKNRERRDKTVAKTRLVKKGQEWIVETVPVNISFEELPEFTDQELRKLKVTDSYVDRLGQLSRVVKKRGIKMVFPCNECDKICQNFSALKLHSRRHDPNKKPFAPKVYKRNAKPVVKKKPEISLENRFAKPKPIMNNHKCDDKLKKFYETHIRGADIEFWQFLKIFNKMDRENIKDFKDFEGRTEFGIHTNEDRSNNEPRTTEAIQESSVPTPKITLTDMNFKTAGSTKTWISTSKLINRTSRPVSKAPLSTPKLNRHSVKKAVKKPVYKRVIMISKKQHIEREKIKMRLREGLATRTG